MVKFSYFQTFLVYGWQHWFHEFTFYRGSWIESHLENTIDLTQKPTLARTISRVVPQLVYIWTFSQLALWLDEFIFNRRTCRTESYVHQKAFSSTQKPVLDTKLEERCSTAGSMLLSRAEGFLMHMGLHSTPNENERIQPMLPTRKILNVDVTGNVVQSDNNDTS